MHEILAGTGTHSALGVLPLGTGNDSPTPWAFPKIPNSPSKRFCLRNHAGLTCRP